MQPFVTVTLAVPDWFGPQLRHLRTEFTGIDVCNSRSVLEAWDTGVVPTSEHVFGTRCEVLPGNGPIVIPLKRAGLQHDRFTKLQLRQGDFIRFYITQATHTEFRRPAPSA